jgi:hypothetical protein
MRLRSTTLLTSLLVTAIVSANAQAATAHTAVTDASSGGSTVTGDCTSTHNGFLAGMFTMTCKLFKQGNLQDEDIYDADMQGAGTSHNVGDVSTTVQPQCVFCTRNLSRYFDQSGNLEPSQVDGVGCDASGGPGTPK